MFFSDIKKQDKAYIAHTYARMELDIAKGSGARCEDVSGRGYIDFSSGIGVNSLGFVSGEWATAVKAQLDTLAHTSNLYYTQPQTTLAKHLCERTGMKRVFFSNSGAEANECAIKVARKYSSDKYSHDRHEIITLENSFHGRTIATLAATGQDVFHKNFGPFPAGFVYAKPTLDDVTAKLTDRTCAVMIECIQGEGGVVPLEQEFVTGLAKLCAERDILLVVDEVQTGVGRTGKFLCSRHYGIEPDIVTLAKGLGGGLPIGATLMGEKTKDTLGAGDHGSTFGGNPVICAGAAVVVAAVDGKLLDGVMEKGNYLAERLIELDSVHEISGMGLMLGLLLDEDMKAAEVVALCVKAGLVVLTAKQKLRLLPPLNISTAELEQGVAILESVLKSYRTQLDEEKANS